MEIEAFVKSEGSGRYLIVDSPVGGYEMEYEMIASVDSECILKPRIESPERLSFVVTDCMSLREYLDERVLGGSELKNILLSLRQAAAVMADHLMGEENLLISDEFIQIDRHDSVIRLCAVPRPCENVSERLAVLMKRLLLRTDPEDKEGFRLAALIYREACREEARIYDLMNVLLQTGSAILPAAPSYQRAAEKAVPTPAAPQTEERHQLAHQSQWSDSLKSGLSIADLDETDADLSHIPAPTRGFAQSVFADDQEGGTAIASPSPDDSRKALITRIIISQCMMAVGLLAVTLLKGLPVAVRVLPVYAILSLCTALYFLIELFALKKHRPAAK